jgi:hypothetical protein
MFSIASVFHPRRELNRRTTAVEQAVNSSGRGLDRQNTRGDCYDSARCGDPHIASADGQPIGMTPNFSPAVAILFRSCSGPIDTLILHVIFNINGRN